MAAKNMQKCERPAESQRNAATPSRRGSSFIFFMGHLTTESLPSLRRSLSFPPSQDGMIPASSSPEGPMDLSTKARRKLRLEEFLRQNLDEAPAGRVIQWVDRERGAFRILWTHQSSGAFTQDDAALFRYWALARGKPASLSSVELKQSLRMALNKSPSVIRLSASHDEYRYFRFTGWESRRSSPAGTKSPKTLKRRDSSPAGCLPPTLPCRRSDWQPPPDLSLWTAGRPDFLTKGEAFAVPNGEEAPPEGPALCRRPFGLCWGPDRADPQTRNGALMAAVEIPDSGLSPPCRGSPLSRTDSRLSEQAMGQRLMERQARRTYLSRGQLIGEETGGEKLLGDGPSEGQQPRGEAMTEAPSPQTYVETREAQHSVPSYLESYHRTDYESHLSLYGDAGAFPKLMMNYDHRLTGAGSPYYVPSYDTGLTPSNNYRRLQAFISY